MTASSRLPQGESNARTMLLFLACLLAAATAAPSYYDQRQDGKYNSQLDLSNVMLIIGIPKKLPYGDVLSLFLRNSKAGNDNIQAQDRADTQVLEAFVEPNTPYRVDIDSESDRSVGGEGKSHDNEVIIAGRRRLETEPQHQEDEMKLIGATEQCGPDRERDPVTLTCRFRVDAIPEKTPEVVLATA